MKKEIIEVVRFSFSQKNLKILKDISFSIEEGDYISIVGPNGAGKTTLLKCLDRIYNGGTGEICIAGKPIEQYRQKEFAKIVSYVPQADDRIPPFTVYEFVMMGRYPYLTPFFSPGNEDTKAVLNVLAITDTLVFKDRYLGTLSGGERQKVYIAAALAQGAKVLLLDEPTTFLDPKHETDIHNLLKTVNREQGVTIISVTHNINSAALTSSRILALKEGKIAYWGPTENFMQHDILQGLYRTSFLFVSHPFIKTPIVITGAAL